MAWNQLALLPNEAGEASPSDRGPNVALVPDGAQVAGGVGDALMEVNEQEHDRRAAVGLGAVTSLGLLDRLLGLPQDEWVGWDCLTSDEVRRLHLAPVGVLERSPSGIRRRLERPVAVPLVLVRNSSWRRGLRTASAFEPFAQRVLVFDGPDRDLSRLAWEADFLGVGVWLQHDRGTEEVVAPAPWRQHYVKAAGWRFCERVYRSWLNATRPAG